MNYTTYKIDSYRMGLSRINCYISMVGDGSTWVKPIFINREISNIEEFLTVLFKVNLLDLE